jgi:hypothetical protein
LLKGPAELSIYSLPADYIADLDSNGLLDDDLMKFLKGPRYDSSKLLELLTSQDIAMKTSIATTLPALYNSLVNYSSFLK